VIRQPALPGLDRTPDIRELCRIPKWPISSGLACWQSDVLSGLRSGLPTNDRFSVRIGIWLLYHGPLAEDSFSYISDPREQDEIIDCSSLYFERAISINCACTVIALNSSISSGEASTSRVRFAFAGECRSRRKFRGGNSAKYLMCSCTVSDSGACVNHLP